MTPERPWPSDDAVVLATRHWLERAVIGLSLCPFARAVHAHDQIRYRVSAAETAEALLVDLTQELRALSAANADEVETTLLVAPRALADFFEFNAFLRQADAALVELGLEGELQIASFHPDYQFGDLDSDDVANGTNRSPYPMLHLLREASVSRAVESFPEAAQIFEKNIRTLRALGHDGLRRALSGDPPIAEAPPAVEPGTPKSAGFAELSLSAELLAVLGRLGFEHPTAIQTECIPALASGRDLVGQSKTGSGKTLAFALPILERLKLAPRELQALVLCPTRELGAQVAREFRKLGSYRPGLSVAVLAGGEPGREQARLLEAGAHVAVGTPGRVLDHLRRRTLKVHRVSTVVLDEADRMLDMGFLPDIEKVLKALPEARQTVFFSATFPTSIRELCAKYQENPIFVRMEEAGERTPDIRELLVRVDSSQKLDALTRALEQHGHDSALVFANLKLGVAEIERALRRAGLSVASLHGDLEQRDRDRVMAKFRNGSTRVLVATDVAARGIDLDDLDLVVNYDLPDRPEAYVHRIGRTGRAGKSGLSISFCTPDDAGSLAAIERLTGRPLTPFELTAKAPLRSAEASRAVEPAAAKMETLRVSGGRKDKLRPGDILGALTGDAGGLSGDDVGKIEIHERFSFVAVSKRASQAALKSLRDGRIKGRRFRVDLVD